MDDELGNYFNCEKSGLAMLLVSIVKIIIIINSSIKSISTLMFIFIIFCNQTSTHTITTNLCIMVSLKQKTNILNI